MHLRVLQSGGLTELNLAATFIPLFRMVCLRMVGWCCLVMHVLHTDAGWLLPGRYITFTCMQR
jgi:hypothetical protein